VLKPYCPITSGTTYISSQFGMYTGWSAYWGDFGLLTFFLMCILLLMYGATKRINHLNR